MNINNLDNNNFNKYIINHYIMVIYLNNNHKILINNF